MKIFLYVSLKIIVEFNYQFEKRPEWPKTNFKLQLLKLMPSFGVISYKFSEIIHFLALFGHLKKAWYVFDKRLQVRFVKP